MLNEKKLKMIDLLIEGNIEKTEIAKEIGVSRQTIYEWLKDEEVLAEYDRRLNDNRTKCNRRLQTWLNPLLHRLYFIAMNGATRDSKDVAIYLVNRVLDTPKETMTVDKATQNNVDPLAMFEEIVKKPPHYRKTAHEITYYSLGGVQ